MRLHGTLIKWNDDRGFGFVALPQSGEEVFVHISAFPRDGVRPRIGELISFEVGKGSDGRKRAERVERPAKRTTNKASRTPARRSNIRAGGFTMVAVAALAAAGYSAYMSRDSTGNAGAEAIPQSITQPITSKQQFQCDGRTHCSQMSSCAEAKYFLQHCPNTKMDGDNDRIPCEDQFCR